VGVPVAVETVTVASALVPPGVTLLGEKPHDACAGRPVQERVTGSSTGPSCGVTVTVYVAGAPRVTVTLLGIAAMAKSVTCSVTVVVSPSAPELPTTSRSVEPVGVVPAVVEMVSVEAAGLAPGVTGLTENEHTAPAGSLSHERVTGSSNVPPRGVTVAV
jgi:hypothetical protein